MDAGNGLPIDAVYTVDLTVTNDFGSADFDGAFTLTVVDYIEPIDAATFAYDPVEAIQGGEFTAEKRAGFVGDEAVLRWVRSRRRLKARLRSIPRRVRFRLRRATRYRWAAMRFRLWRRT